MGLDQYRSKRDFDVTAEPDGSEIAKQSAHPLFVVQKHQASHLHFDLRLEVDGVLKSWAVPKGPSLNPRVKRLAIEVEDHPLSYAAFEGVIPAPQYGGGSVIVWDTGNWVPEGSPQQSLKLGKIDFTLHGQRLAGRWRLIRTKASTKQPQWLLSKVQDEYANTGTEVSLTFQTSVLSGRTVEMLDSPMPNFIEPKLPIIVKEPPHGEHWIHEIKVDGYRMQARWSTSGEFTLRTRSGLDWTARYPAISEPLKTLNIAGTMMDGELAAIDAQGKSAFSAIQAAANSDAKGSLAYFAFDLLYLRGNDLRPLPLGERKNLLRQLLRSDEVAKASRLQFMDHIERNATPLLVECRRLGLEGIVSKQSDRPYTSGRASDWLKYKERFRESFVIGGYETNADGLLSSLLLGYFDEHKSLRFVGRVGTGWSTQFARELMTQLAQHQTASRPFADQVPSAVKRAKTKAHWLQPATVATVEFADRTESGLLRQASFVSLDESTSPVAITRADVFGESDALNDKGLSNPLQTTVHPIPSARRKRIVAASLPGLTNSDRILYPSEEITKAEVASYLFQVSQWMLPHVANRPISFVRCPEGIEGDHYFQRHPQPGFPEAIRHVPSGENEQSFLLTLEDQESLLATAQVSALELHPWGCQVDRMDRPDRMIIDLDPDVTISWPQVVSAAALVRDHLIDQGLISFVKTTGGKGLHLVAPLVRRTTWANMLEASKTIADELVRMHPKLFVSNMAKAKRHERIFVDYHRNRRGATAIAAYSPRARAGATVSTPVTWEELPYIVPDQFTLRTIPARLASLDHDPWEAMLTTKQYLPKP